MAEMKLEIPPDIVLSVVKAQVVAALGKSESLIAGVVESALNKKVNSYDRTTIFEEQVTKMIHDVATESFKEWLAEHRDAIRAEMRKQLTAKKQKVLGEIVEGFTKELTNIYARISLDFRHDQG